MQYQTINPYTEELVRNFPLHADDEIDAIIAQAQKTYATDWSRRSIADRKAVIKKEAALLRENLDAYARLSTLEMGKLFREARSEAMFAMVFRARTEDEAVALANDSPFGLGATVIAKDVERGKRVARRIESGMVFINEVTTTAPELPFGGVKNSGYGRELSRLGIGEFVNKKLIRVAA